MERIVRERYESFDGKRRAAEAEVADREALEELSRIEDEARLFLSKTDKPRRKGAKEDILKGQGSLLALAAT